MYVIFVIIVIGIIGIIWWRNIISPAKESIEKHIDSKDKYDSVGFNKENGLLTVYKRGALIESKITIKEYRHTNYSYNPAKLIYTSATVGGVTTGGFDTTKASYSPTSQDKTGKYALYFRGAEIKEISILDGSDKAQKNSALKQFYNKARSRFVLEHQIVSRLSGYEKEMLKNAIISNDYQTMSVLSKDDTIARKLTYDECAAIKAWIGGID